MKINPHLSFDGQCEDAFKLYEKCFDGKISVMMSYGKSPMAERVSQEWQQKIMHSTLTIGDQVLTGSDAFPGYYLKPQGTWISMTLGSVDQAEKVFSTLSKNAVITMPLQETFWAARFGMLIDQFGTPWMIKTSK